VARLQAIEKCATVRDAMDLFRLIELIKAITYSFEGSKKKKSCSKQNEKTASKYSPGR